MREQVPQYPIDDYTDDHGSGFNEGYGLMDGDGDGFYDDK